MPKTGKVFPAGRDDWVLFHPGIPAKLKQLVRDGFKIVIFSNQKGISSGKNSAVEITGKISDLFNQVGPRVIVMARAHSDLDRIAFPSGACN